MSKPRLMFLSVNDGTDTRVRKELLSLSRKFHVTFVGVRQEDNGPNRLPVCITQVVIPGLRRDAKTVAKLALTVYRLKPASYDSIHVVNENLLLLLSPLLLGSKNIVLDVFDSIFLKREMAAGMARWLLQWLAHLIADTVFVTDVERRALIPGHLRYNVSVLQNYPQRLEFQSVRRQAKFNDPIKIFFSGSLSSARGTHLLQQLIETNAGIEVIAAGWVYDESARQLCANPSVRYLGVLDAAGAARAAVECDFILCVYSPDVPNNIHASPNKIYDGALLGVPVIINAEVIASKIVSTHGLGVVLPSYSISNPAYWVNELRKHRQLFQSKPLVDSPYVWDTCEPVLLDAHTC